MTELNYCPLLYELKKHLGPFSNSLFISELFMQLFYYITSLFPLCVCAFLLLFLPHGYIFFSACFSRPIASGLEKYLEHMESVLKAVRYFKDHNPGSLELTEVVSIYINILFWSNVKRPL